MQEITDVHTRVSRLKAKLREMQAVRNALNDDIYVVIVTTARLEYAEARAAEAQAERSVPGQSAAELARRTCASTLTRPPETHPRKAPNAK